VKSQNSENIGRIGFGKRDELCFEPMRMDLSLQLYSLKNQMEADLEGTLARIREMGYTAVETAGDYGLEVKRWIKYLNKNELSVSAAHVILGRLEQELPQLVEFFGKLGTSHLIVPVPPEGEGITRYIECAYRVNRVAAEVDGLGWQLSYHNHHWEFQDLGRGKTGMEILLAETDPALVKFQVDTAWALAGGGDVLEFLHENRDRVRCLHAKEYGVENKDEPPMGEGDVPFSEIIPLAIEEGWQITVEHEPGEAAVEGVRQSAEFLHGLLADGGTV